jgi:sugar O-acyltransferase (sialic acid O-acetyltransferase NeuD family)
MKKLIIVGAGGFGREVVAWAQHIQPLQREWKLEGMLDSNPSALKDRPCDLRIVGDPLTFEPADGDIFVCSIGDPAARLSVCRSMKSRGARFTTLIHPSAVVGPSCRLGEGCILCPHAITTTNVICGDFVILNLSVTVGHDAQIGSGSILSPHCSVSGYARLGEGVFLGSNAAILPAAVVGDYARVGAGSVVLRNVRSHTTVVGVPAREVFGFGKSTPPAKAIGDPP